MRAKRAKKYRKIMDQYGITFGFREPYQVLVDSNHLRTLHAYKMPLHRYLENTLHGKVKPFITKCTLASILQTTDLHTSQRPEFLPPPLDLPLRHCSHSGIDGEDEAGVLGEEECLMDLLSGGVTGNQQPKNKQHFVLATADPLPVKNKKDGRSGRARRPTSAPKGEDVRAQAREIPGVPIIYVKRSVMILEELSNASLGVRRREEKDKFREGLLGTGSRKRKRDGHDGEANNDTRQDVGEAGVAAPRKKTKKVRGPNPLSVLKKKPKLKKIQQMQDPAEAPAQEASANVNGASTENGQPKAKRRRKHGKKRDSSAGEGVNHHVSSELNNGMPDADEV